MSRRPRWVPRSLKVLCLAVHKPQAVASARLLAVSVLPLAVHKPAVRLQVALVRLLVVPLRRRPASARRPRPPLRRPLTILTVRLPVLRPRRLRASSISRSTRSAARWWLTLVRSIPTGSRRKVVSVVHKLAVHKLAVLLPVVASVVLLPVVLLAVATVIRVPAVTALLLLVVATVVLLPVAASVVLLRAEATAVLLRAAATARRPVVATVRPQRRRVATAHRWAACPAAQRRWCTPVVAVRSAPSETRSW